MSHVRALIAVAVLLALGEFADSFAIDAPVAAIVTGVLFLLGAELLRRGRRTAGIVVVGALCLLELIGLPMYERASVSDWVIQIAFGVVSLVGLVLAVMAGAATRGAGSTAA
jgi:hypothetical protein